MRDPVIQAEGLRFTYPAERTGAGADAPFRLRLDDWTVARGERVALFGPSGCGKSTLLDLVAGVRVPEAGRLVVEGRDVASLGVVERRAHRIRHMGFVFQDFPLVDYLDVLDNVLLPYRLNLELDLDADARGRALELLERLGVGGKSRRAPERLSQGERQRVAIARALVTRPSLVLADEPTAGLDPDTALSVVELLEELSEERGLSLLLVTHDPVLRARFARSLDVAACSDPGHDEVEP
ncbi:MAG: ATP-binding cassette domain-containing protein [Acidobacteriota bacterium]